ncbi:hypothetical protein [Eubacterium sp.]|uniref:hypothetical protein n=1 Tax=Eubacterium sp. TaxID=142586 RepID=UPI002FCB035E
MGNEVANKQYLDGVNLTNGVFNGASEYMVGVKMAKALASSTIVPKDYQGKEGNCLIAIDMASRMNASPMMVMQNLYIVNGRPAWSSQFIIAMINRSKKYKTELQFKMSGVGDDLSCFAFVEDYNGHIVEGPLITMEMARSEGWTTKNGSKWKTMPEVMIRYRAASFFGRLNCPDMIMGIYSVDEANEIENASYTTINEEIKEKANTIPLDFDTEKDEIEINIEMPNEEKTNADPPDDVKADIEAKIASESAPQMEMGF